MIESCVLISPAPQTRDASLYESPSAAIPASCIRVENGIIKRHVDEDEHPLRPVENERLVGVDEQESDAEDHGGDAQRHGDDEVEDGRGDAVLAAATEDATQ